MAQQFVLFIIINDTGFYWAHRIFHHPALYGSTGDMFFCTHDIVLFSLLDLTRATFAQQFTSSTTSTSNRSALQQPMQTRYGARSYLYVRLTRLDRGLACQRDPHFPWPSYCWSSYVIFKDQSMFSFVISRPDRCVDPVTWWLWMVMRIVETVDAHSGYDFPFSPFAMLRKIQSGADRYGLFMVPSLPVSLCSIIVLEIET